MVGISHRRPANADVTAEEKGKTTSDLLRGCRIFLLRVWFNCGYDDAGPREIKTTKRKRFFLLCFFHLGFALCSLSTFECVCRGRLQSCFVPVFLKIFSFWLNEWLNWINWERFFKVVCRKKGLMLALIREKIYRLLCSVDYGPFSFPPTITGSTVSC